MMVMLEEDNLFLFSPVKKQDRSLFSSDSVFSPSASAAVLCILDLIGFLS
jgi:hypothetical protein